jgi:hypothetical protein
VQELHRRVQVGAVENGEGKEAKKRSIAARLARCNRGGGKVDPSFGASYRGLLCCCEVVAVPR